MSGKLKIKVIAFYNAGLGMIYFAGLALYDVPYPSPVGIQFTESRKLEKNLPDQVILASTEEYIYKTQFVYEEKPNNKKYYYDISSSKIGFYGHIVQTRKLKQDLLTPDTDTLWEDCFNHIVKGPIINVSKNPNNGQIQFAVLYRLLDDDHLRYYARIYYFPTGDSIKMEFKDILLPGTTAVSTISLEDDYIIFHRDPDKYRFRIATLPNDLISPPHSEDAKTLYISESIPGDLTRALDQPKRTEAHTGVLSRLYSANPNIFRVFMLDIHKTPSHHYINTTITDGIVSKSDDQHNWIRQHRLNTTHVRMIENTVEYVGIMEGARLYPEMIEIDIPSPFISRSKCSKTMVISIMSSFYTFDFTNQTSIRKTWPKYKQENDEVLPELYHFQADGVSEGGASYDDTNILGLELNEDATLLAVWTELNTIYIYKRGISDEVHQDINKDSPHYLKNSMPWNFRMAIDPIDGKLGTVPVGSVLFWKNDSGERYISVGMKSNAVNTYFIDRFVESKEWSFTGFVKERYGLVFGK
ncbi:hypothetical protein G6F56_004211 [Rhizopus delemar]|nr:hypothetical protein G6F56_004211 [Rhizopus delemar]